MWVIWSKELLPQALKSCQKCNKSPNLVTLHTAAIHSSCCAISRLIAGLPNEAASSII